MTAPSRRESETLNKRLALLVPLALIASMIAIGCGGSDDNSSDSDSSSDSASAPTKAEFISQADDICGKANKELQTEIHKQFGTKTPNKADAAKFTEDSIIPNLEQQLSDLQALTPPDGDDPEVGEVFSTLGKDIDALKADPASSLSPDAMKESGQKAEAYGFDNCGSGGTA
jgi:hypothetical protein